MADIMPENTSPTPAYRDVTGEVNRNANESIDANSTPDYISSHGAAGKYSLLTERTNGNKPLVVPRKLRKDQTERAALQHKTPTEITQKLDISQLKQWNLTSSTSTTATTPIKQYPQDTDLLQGSNKLDQAGVTAAENPLLVIPEEVSETDFSAGNAEKSALITEQSSELENTPPASGQDIAALPATSATESTDKLELIKVTLDYASSAKATTESTPYKTDILFAIAQAIRAVVTSKSPTNSRVKSTSAFSSTLLAKTCSTIISDQSALAHSPVKLVLGKTEQKKTSPSHLFSSLKAARSKIFSQSFLRWTAVVITSIILFFSFMQLWEWEGADLLVIFTAIVYFLLGILFMTKYILKPHWHQVILAVFWNATIVFGSLIAFVLID